MHVDAKNGELIKNIIAAAIAVVESRDIDLYDNAMNEFATVDIGKIDNLKNELDAFFNKGESQ